MVEGKVGSCRALLSDDWIRCEVVVWWWSWGGWKCVEVVGGAVKEGEGGNVAVDGKDFGKEIFGSPTPSTNLESCRSNWASSGEPKK
jgi:hypothetical protein